MLYRIPFQIRVPENSRSPKAFALAYEILEQFGRVDETLESFSEKLRDKKDLRVVFGYCTNGVDKGRGLIQQGSKVGSEEAKAVSVLIGYECHNHFGLEDELEGIDDDEQGWVSVPKPFYLICRTLEGYQGRGIVSTLISEVDRNLGDYTHFCVAEGSSVKTAEILTRLGFIDFERGKFYPSQSVDTLLDKIQNLETSDGEGIDSIDDMRVRWIRERLIA